MANKPKAQEVRDYATSRAEALGLNPGMVIGLIEELSSYGTGRTGNRLGLMGAPADGVKDIDAFLGDWKGQIDSGLVSLMGRKQQAGGTDLGAAISYLGGDPTKPDAKLAQRAIRAYTRGAKYTGEPIDEGVLTNAYSAFGVKGNPASDLKAAGLSAAPKANRSVGARAQENFEIAQNPNVARYLGMISQAEGADYNTSFGGGTFDDFSHHPNIQKQFKQTDGKTNSSGAAGRYQFLKKTWDDVSGSLGLKDFSPASQDAAAVELLRRSGSLSDVMSGNFTTAVGKDNKTWASLPGSPYAQKTRSPDFVARALSGGPAAATGMPQRGGPPEAPVDSGAVTASTSGSSNDVSEEELADELYSKAVEAQAEEERGKALEGRVRAAFASDDDSETLIGGGVDAFIDSIAKEA
ncbi:muramidase (phage lysozyme) [Variovorax boronicumulans]|uniref:glycoside hydrolase family 24 protein n=1 Tax=Variovorax boronicumulans TaxID=436515 RepID=UPI00277D9606|nr:glycoside hydrolase family 104 protein [Variovorax boronicumulans]MDP9908236.1 muramidase (phage lysozyme) [Variovorax boronicumulans]